LKVTAGTGPEHFRLTSANEGMFCAPVVVVESTCSATYVTTQTDHELTLVETGRSSN
jgi:multiple sugar transport system ATP-binding protein